MVFSCEGGDYNSGRERPKTHQSFTLPDLKWGVQRSLRCMKVRSEERIEEYGEKIMSDLKMKDSIFKERRRAACKAPVTESGNFEGAKFMSTLSKKEMEDDYMTMMGRRPPRRPKKRPRTLQKQIDLLHPAFYFTEVTEDIYEVPDAAETRKR
ncbi:hypothetical protein Rs2_04383 [Raphanus sativus]|nr:hypothetical protein Rs2_04383 [Raphanus sativus]